MVCKDPVTTGTWRAFRRVFGVTMYHIPDDDPRYLAADRAEIEIRAGMGGSARVGPGVAATIGALLGPASALHRNRAP